jgi:hypothetical protein
LDVFALVCCIWSPFLFGLSDRVRCFYVEDPTQEWPEIPKLLYGMTFANLTVALCVGSMLSESLPTRVRLRNAIAGFVMVDLGGLMAHYFESHLGEPKGSRYWAVQTAGNLQDIAGGATWFVSVFALFKPGG